MLLAAAASRTPTTAMSLRAAAIQPRLHNQTWAERVRLSDDGFNDSTASINLSHTLKMGLSADGATLSYRGLAELGLSTRQAWDLSADNLVVAARRPQGTRFYLRDAVQTTLIDAPSIQIRVPGAPVTAWLAHPRTFTILNKHLEQRLGPNITYWAPLSDLLIAVSSDGQACPELSAWASQMVSGSPGGGEKITGAALSYNHGFPSEMRIDTQSRRHLAA